MEKIKLELGYSDILINISNKNIDLTTENVNFNIKKNDIIDYEKGIYKNKNKFNVNLFFYLKDVSNRNTNKIIDNGRGDAHREKYIYEDDFTTNFGKSTARLGFKFPEEINKNSFKKSNVVIEFYSDINGLSNWLGSEIYYFTDITPYSVEKITYTKAETYNGKLIDVILNNVFEPKCVIPIGDKFLSEYFGYRDFSTYMSDSDSAIIYYKILLQNAKNGNRYYMINGSDGAVNSINYNEELLYNEIILYKDKTFEFSNIENGNLNFKELILY